MPPNDERSRPFIPPEDGDFPDSPFRSDGTWPQEDVVDSPSPSGGLSTSVDRGEHAAADTYWSISRRPLTSLVFSLPLVLAYEGGVLLLGRGSPRNGADVWLRTLLDHLGFGQYFLLPVLTVLGLLAWHHIEHDRWRFSPAVLVGMAGESILWAAVLLGVARLQDRFWPLAAGAAEGVFARLVAFCGAGLYEEVLFRLLLLPAVGWLAARLGAGGFAAAAWGVIGSSLLFSWAHYVGPLGDAFDPYSFTFRFLAGVFFALLFEVRGFGIAAGSHAAYDILVGLGP
jgi:membrane protease YdiL (CAAX protease family)